MSRKMAAPTSPLSFASHPTDSTHAHTPKYTLTYIHTYIHGSRLKGGNMAAGSGFLAWDFRVVKTSIIIKQIGRAHV